MTTKTFIISLFVLFPLVTLAFDITNRGTPTSKNKSNAYYQMKFLGTNKVQEIAILPLPDIWTFGNSVDKPEQGYFMQEMINKDDDMDNWSEMITLENFPKSPRGPSPKDMLNELKKTQEEQCPGSTQWNEILEDGKRILYEVRAKPCLDWPDKHEISLIIDGEFNRFRFAYTKKVSQLSSDNRSAWIERLKNVKVEKK